MKKSVPRRQKRSGARGRKRRSGRRARGVRPGLQAEMEMEEKRVAGGVGDAKSGSELALGFLIILLKQVSNQIKKQENHAKHVICFPFLFSLNLKIVNFLAFTNPGDWLDNHYCCWFFFWTRKN